jgi:hypothetical protein
MTDVLVGDDLEPPASPASTGVALRMIRSGASSSFNVRSEQVVDEGLVAQPSPLGLASHSVEDLGIDPNGD